MTELFDSFVSWLDSTEGHRFMAIAIVSGIAIIITGLIAAWTSGTPDQSVIKVRRIK